MDALGIACWIIGILSAISFAFNLYPQYRQAKKTGLAYGYFVLAFTGNIGAAIFVLFTNIQTGDFQWPLYGNYSIATYFTTRLFIMRIRYGK